MTYYPVESTELMPEDFYERVFTHGYETYFNQPKPEGLDQSFIWQMKDGESLVAARFVIRPWKSITWLLTRTIKGSAWAASL